MNKLVYYAVSYSELASHYILATRVSFEPWPQPSDRFKNSAQRLSQYVEAYIERVELYFEANNIDADR